MAIGINSDWDVEYPEPINALTHPLPDEFSANERAERLMGKRNAEGVVVINLPCEEGYHCPVCEYDHQVGRVYDERLWWSEYNSFLWCSVCNVDYPSVLCMPDVERATTIFLDCIQQMKDIFCGHDE